MVSDQGRGIDEVDLPHVVKFGYRGGNAGRRNHGWWLGLDQGVLVAGAATGTVVDSS